MLTHPILTAAAQAGIRLGHEKFRAFLASHQSASLETPAIHIAGTNGKGSTTAFASQILKEANISSGSYTSPHLIEVNERIMVNKAPISDENLSRQLETIKSAATKWTGAHADDTEVPLTFFELMTASALCHFNDLKLAINVIEVGLGGRLDSTNIVNSVVSVITSIGFDHMDVLGDDLASIASEKSGIIRQNIPVVVGQLPQEAMRIVRMIAHEKDAPLYVLGVDFYMHPNEDNTWNFVWGERSIENLELGLLGLHQGSNAALAIMALLLVPTLQLPARIIREGVLNAHHPGRLEWLSDNILLDCAHNIDGAHTLAAYLKSHPKAQRRTLLLGASEDKDIRAVAVSLQPYFDRILTTHCAHPRAMSAGDVAKSISGLDIPVFSAGPVESIFDYVDPDTEEIVVAGSIFLVGALRAIYASK